MLELVSEDSVARAVLQTWRLESEHPCGIRSEAGQSRPPTRVLEASLLPPPATIGQGGFSPHTWLGKAERGLKSGGDHVILTVSSTPILKVNKPPHN